MNDPIASLRRAEAILRASGDPAGLAVADGLLAALNGSVPGVDAALRIKRHGGAGGLAAVARRERRDRLLRELRRRFFLHLEPRPAARAIASLARSRGRVDPAASRLLADVASCGRLPAERRLADILREIQDPL